MLKQRPAAKSMIVLLADPRDINRYTSRPQPYIAEYLEKTTQPTTVIYEGALGLAENLMSEDGSIAIRIVQEDFCRHLIKRFRKTAGFHFCKYFRTGIAAEFCRNFR